MENSGQMFYRFRSPCWLFYLTLHSQINCFSQLCTRKICTDAILVLSMEYARKCQRFLKCQKRLSQMSSYTQFKFVNSDHLKLSFIFKFQFCNCRSGPNEQMSERTAFLNRRSHVWKFCTSVFQTTTRNSLSLINSVTRLLDYFSTFGHLHQWNFACPKVY